MSLLHNERTKLTANFLTGMAIAVVAVGGFAPLVALASALSSVGPILLVFSVVPVGALLIGTAALFLTRHERADPHGGLHPGEKTAGAIAPPKAPRPLPSSPHRPPSDRAA